MIKTGWFTTTLRLIKEAATRSPRSRWRAALPSRAVEWFTVRASLFLTDTVSSPALRIIAEQISGQGFVHTRSGAQRNGTRSKCLVLTDGCWWVGGPQGLSERRAPCLSLRSGKCFSVPSNSESSIHIHPRCFISLVSSAGRSAGKHDSLGAVSWHQLTGSEL